MRRITALCQTGQGFTLGNLGARRLNLKSEIISVFAACLVGKAALQQKNQVRGEELLFPEPARPLDYSLL